MESFKKRQKEMRRLERRQDKAAKRKEIKLRKAAGIATPDEDAPAVSPDDAPDTPPASDAPGLSH